MKAPAGESARIGVVEGSVCNVAIPPTSCASNGGLLLLHGDQTGTNAAVIFTPRLHDLSGAEEPALENHHHMHGTTAMRKTV